jgi:hypothetical protein|tara:strand:- start:2782 stop:4479 length:1698 start_codon:yes stop_codon:yes gene_type:complete
MKISNFDRNFMPLYLTAIVMVALCFANNLKAEDIEEVVVVAQQVTTTEADALTSTTIVESILPGFSWTAGGTGAFQGYNERGAQTVHTTVYKNGIPANTPGSAWYDFGHEIVSGQNVKVISGANGVMYGSGSIAGTVLIEDTIERSITAKLGSNQERYISVAPTSWFQYTDYTTDQQARNDNTESDTYENQSAKIIADVGDFEFIVSATDYAYDYDNCYTASFSQSNDCLQDGEKLTVSIRNEYFTVGRTEDKAEYYTEGVSTYQNESSRDYFRAGDTVDLSKLLQVTYGVDGSKDQYNEHEQDNYGAFLSINAEFALKYNFGFRVGNADQNAMRIGIESGPFFLNVGTSFRRPNLYEVHGDSWVSANEGLLPEEGTGYEVGFGAISIFKYDFEQAIEYASGYNTTTVIAPATYDTDGNLLTEEVTESVYTSAAYYNTGSYSTQGFRFSNTWGPVSLMLKVNDTEQVRIPEYVAVISWEQNYKGVDYKVKYSGQFDRVPGQYDFLPEGQEFLDDLKKLNIYVGKQFASGINLNFTIDNVTDQEVEVLPYYNSQGREYRLALNYKW